VVVHCAAIQDRDGAKLVLGRLAARFPRLLLIWADGGYAGKLVEWVKEVCHWTLQIVKRSDDTVGFVVRILIRRCHAGGLWNEHLPGWADTAA